MLTQLLTQSLLAFGALFGMLVAGKDSALVAISYEVAMASYGTAPSSKSIEIAHLPPVQILNNWRRVLCVNWCPPATLTSAREAHHPVVRSGRPGCAVACGHGCRGCRTVPD